MAYKRTPRYEPGQALMACSVCGFTYLFPSELRYCDDRLFRCTRTCLEETRLAEERKRTASHRRQDNDNPPLIGVKPSWY